MAFQAEQKIKIQILSSLGTDQVFRLLSDHEVGVVMKTLGLLRNLLSTKPHIDLIMGQHGKQIMQVYKHRWFSGRMLACHAGGPGSIPGRCKFFFLKSIIIYSLSLGNLIAKNVF